MNRKTSSSAMASRASKALNSSSSSKIQKSLAASVLSQRVASKQTGAYGGYRISRVAKQ